MIQKPLYHGGISIHGAVPSPDSTLIVSTGRGLPITRRIVKHINDAWLRPASTYDVSQLNQDWLRI